MNEKVALISSFCDTEEKINVLNENIKTLRNNNFDIIVISPLPLPETVVSNLDYFFYIKDNLILEWPMNVQMYLVKKEISKEQSFTFVATNKDYGWAGLNHVKKLTDIGLLFDYKYLYYMIYDIDIDQNVLNILKNPKNNWIGCFERHGVRVNSSLHLMVFSRENAKKINDLISLEAYVDFLYDKNQNGSTEAFVDTIKKKLQSESPDFFIKDKIFVYRDFFNHSPDGRIRFFVKKDSNNIMSNLKIFFYANENLGKIKLTINNKESEIDVSNDCIFDLGMNFLELKSARLSINEEQVDILKSIESIKYASIIEGNT
jgi:hypothetical protein